MAQENLFPVVTAAEASEILGIPLLAIGQLMFEGKLFNVPGNGHSGDIFFTELSVMALKETNLEEYR
jgi:hypothetical protein